MTACVKSQQDRRTLIIDQQIREQRRSQDQLVKFLVIGPSGSGVSTFIKQLQLTSGKGPNQEELSLLLPKIRVRCIDFISQVESDNISLEELNRLFVSEITARNFNSSKCEKLGQKIYSVWQDPAIQAVLNATDSEREKLLPYNVQYYLAKSAELFRTDYRADFSDWLNWHEPAMTGATEHEVSFNGVLYRFTDLCLNSDKWTRVVNSFQDSTAVIYVFPLNSYACEKTFEKNCEDFKYLLGKLRENCSSLLLLLSKKDIFLDMFVRRKLPFPGYTGSDPNDALELIKDKLLYNYNSEQYGNIRSCRVFCNELTERSNNELIQNLFQATRDMVLHKAIKNAESRPRKSPR